MERNGRNQVDAKREEPREVPGLFLAVSGGGWCLNVGLWIWHHDALHPRAAKRRLREQGRKIRRIDGREFVLCRPREVKRWYQVAAYWRPLLDAEMRRLARLG